MLDPENYLQPVWWKIWLVILASNKIFLLFGMFISHESCLIASGISFKARQEKVAEEYNTIRSMDVTKFSISTTCKDCIGSWNMRTQHWLKYYVMMRNMDRDLPRKTPQMFPKLWAFFVSALFHGYYIGYVLFFLGLFLIDIGWAALNKTRLAQKT